MVALVAAVSVLFHVTGPASSTSTAACFLRLSAHLSGGGSMVYCMKTFRGSPGPNAVVHDEGSMTFTRDGGSLRAKVLITQRFAADGKHARQMLSGRVVGGTGRYSRFQGAISGGGTDLEIAPGQVSRSDLHYVAELYR
jgi:hypothetical protein